MNFDSFVSDNNKLLVAMTNTKAGEYKHDNETKRPDYMQCVNSTGDMKMYNNNETNDVNDCECCDVKSSSCDEYAANDMMTNCQELLQEDHEYIFHTNSLLTAKELIYYNDINGCDDVDNNCTKNMLQQEQQSTLQRKSCKNDDSKHISSCNNISVSNTFETSSTQQGSVHEGTYSNDKTCIFCDDMNVRELLESRCGNNNYKVCYDISEVATVILPTATDAIVKESCINAYEKTNMMYGASENILKNNCQKEEDEDDLFFINSGVLLNDEFNDIGNINLCYSDDSNDDKDDAINDVDISAFCSDEFTNANGNNNNNNNNINIDAKDKVKLEQSNEEILPNKSSSQSTQQYQVINDNDNVNVKDEKQRHLLCDERVLPLPFLFENTTIQPLQCVNNANTNASSTSSISNAQADRANQVYSSVIIVDEHLPVNKAADKLTSAVEEFSNNNIYTAIAGRPLFAKSLNFRRFLHQKNIPPHVEQEESTGVFVGQLPSSYSESDIEALLKCIGNENNQIVHVRDVKCHNRERTCAFVIINASALGSLLMYTKRILCDVNTVWVVTPEQASQLPMFVQTMPRDNLRGVPKGALVLEKLTPQTKHKHGPAVDHSYLTTHSIQSILPTLPLSPLATATNTNTSSNNTTLTPFSLLPPPPPPSLPLPLPPPPFHSSPSQTFSTLSFPAPSTNSLYTSSSYNPACNSFSAQMQTLPALTTKTQLPSSSATASNSAWLINAANTDTSNKWIGNTGASAATTSSQSSLSTSHNGPVAQSQLLFNTNYDINNHLPIYAMTATKVSKYNPLTMPLNVLTNEKVPMHTTAPSQQEENKMINYTHNIFDNTNSTAALPSYNKNYWSGNISQQQQQQEEQLLVKTEELRQTEQEQAMLIPTIMDGSTVYRFSNLHEPSAHSVFEVKGSNLGNTITSRDCQSSILPAHTTPLTMLSPNPIMPMANAEMHSFTPSMPNTRINNDEIWNQINIECTSNNVYVDSTAFVEPIPITLLTTNNTSTSYTFDQRSNMDVNRRNNSMQSKNENNYNNIKFSNTCANMPTVADTSLHISNSQYSPQHATTTTTTTTADVVNQFPHNNDINKINDRNWRNHNNKSLIPTAFTLSTVLTSTRCSCGLPLVLSQSANSVSCTSCQCEINSRQIAYWCPLSHVTVCTTCSLKPQICQSRSIKRNC